jgi:hypothetical protein
MPPNPRRTTSPSRKPTSTSPLPKPITTNNRLYAQTTNDITFFRSISGGQINVNLTCESGHCIANIENTKCEIIFIDWQDKHSDEQTYFNCYIKSNDSHDSYKLLKCTLCLPLSNKKPFKVYPITPEKTHDLIRSLNKNTNFFDETEIYQDNENILKKWLEHQKTNNIQTPTLNLPKNQAPQQAQQEPLLDKTLTLLKKHKSYITIGCVSVFGSIALWKLYTNYHNTPQECPTDETNSDTKILSPENHVTQCNSTAT